MSTPSLERQDDDVFVLRLGDGENRCDPAFVTAVDLALSEVEACGQPVALVSVGSDRFYSNGYDLDALTAMTRDERREFIRAHQQLLARLLVFPHPTVAAISGHAFGAGALFAFAHDVCWMRADHGFLCMPEIDVRIPLRRGMVALLEARLAPRSLRDLVLTGTRYSGMSAVDAGLIAGACSGETLLTRAKSLAAELAGKHPPTLGALKRVLHREAFDRLSGLATG